MPILEGMFAMNSLRRLRMTLSLCQPTVEDALFRIVSFKTFSQIHSFKERLMSSKDDALPVGRKVRGLNFWQLEDYPSRDELWNGILSVVIMTPSVYEVQMSDPAVMQQSVLLHLIHQTNAVLRSLTIRIAPSCGNALDLIRSLINLEFLCVNSTITSPNVWEFASYHPLRLPLVKHFEWHHEWECKDPGMLDFLAGCRFHLDCIIELSIFDHSMRHLAPRLAPLFRAHLSKLVLNFPGISLVPLRDIIMQSSCLTLVGWLDKNSPLLFTNKSPYLPAHLFMSTEVEDYRHLKSVLIALSKLKRPPGSPISVLHIGVGYSEIEFNWSDGDLGSHAALIGTLLGYAMKLYKLNIIIVDKTGASVETLMSNHRGARGVSFVAKRNTPE
jgi:hypothetical protein